MLPSVEGEFRVASDPELRFTPSGKAVASLLLVADKKKKNESTGEWEDDKVCWLRATAWDRMAENIAESCQKGDLIVVRGALETRNYETQEGEKRTSLEVNIYDVGMSIRWNSARVERTSRQQGGGAAPAASQATGGGQSQPAAASPGAADPWGTPAADTGEPPF